MNFNLLEKFNFPVLLLTIVSVLGCDRSVGPDLGTDGDPFTPQIKTCIDGFADTTYPCSTIDLLSVVTLSELQGNRLNDIWGWTDTGTGREYAIVGLNDGVTFVDITDPLSPEVLGKLPESFISGSQVANSVVQDIPRVELHEDEESHKGESTWRDFKVYKDHLFVVSDGQPHGMQIFDLQRLRTVNDPPVTFTEDGLYAEFGNAHNIAINEETGFAYILGSNTFGGGLHIVDITEPLNPKFSGFHADSSVGRASTGYVHDTQCVLYSGPDADHSNREICINSSETHLVVADVTDKDSTFTISKASYPEREYVHQGWFTEDHRYFLSDDELDEIRNGQSTSTFIWDLGDLDQPVLIGTFVNETSSIDHNQYINGNLAYQSNYTTGLRIISIDNIASGQLEEVAYFDTNPLNDEPTFDGSWSNYPFFESGNIIVSDVNNGLFILKPNL